jgi:uncharacterized protein (TIGR03083 family)
MVIETAQLYAPLHEELIRLLDALPPSDWLKPTVCPDWAVRDIAAHLLDIDVRRLSLNRDNGELAAPDKPIRSAADLIAFLDRFNAQWIIAARRMSPKVLTDLLRVTGPQVSAHVTALGPMAHARFPVEWAGEAISANWFDVARDYTERWHHQQQIRDAVGARPLTDAKWLKPVFETFLRALPYIYRDTPAPHGTAVEVEIGGEAGGVWTIVRSALGWKRHAGSRAQPEARIRMTADHAWRHLTNQPDMPMRTDGPTALTNPFRRAITVMATPRESAIKTKVADVTNGRK